METESNHHDTGAPQGGARTDGNKGTNSGKVTDFLNNPPRVLSTTHARRQPRESVASRWDAIARTTPEVLSNATHSQQPGPVSQNPLANFLSNMRQRSNVSVPDYMSANVLRSHVAQSQTQVGSDDHEPLPPGTEEPSDSGNGVDGGDRMVTPPENNVDDDNQGLSESQRSCQS